MKSKDEAFLHLQPEDGSGQAESIALATCGCALHRDYRDTGDPAFVMCAGHQHAYQRLFTPAGSSSAARAAAGILSGRGESLLDDEGVDERVCQEVAQEIVAAIVEVRKEAGPAGPTCTRGPAPHPRQVRRGCRPGHSSTG
jgi:hypothetical protein